MRDRNNNSDKNKSLLARVWLTIAAVFASALVAVTCALCIDFSPAVTKLSPEQGEATASTSYTNKTALAGQIVNGDVITYSAGTHYTVTIGPGTYKFEAYGAKGANSSAGGTGGSGGYSVGTYTTTAQQTIYIYVGSTGGAGTNTSTDVHAGGYNGGGASGYNGGGGGGATHFATADGLLSSLSGNTAAILMVAGGGGGAQNRSGGGGGGGNANGACCPTSSYGTGGCGGGTTGPHGVPISSHSSGSQSGSFGQGGPGLKGGDGNWGGGGGGGYYGGCGVTTDGSVVDDKGGGGGSGYIKSTLTDTSASASSNNAGEGIARITAISVNRPPTGRGASYTVNARGVASNVAVTASAIASDPDGQSVYFTNGNSSNYDTLTTTANTGLYYTSACSSAVSASKYFTWTWSSTSQLNLTGVVLFPRAGVDGAVASGNNVVITLYTKIRDTYNTSTARGVSTISFTVTVPPATMSLKTGTQIAETIVGTSNTTTAPDNPATATGIYNTATGKNTLFIKKALVIGQPFTAIRAVDLINFPSGLSTSNHTAVISVNSTTAITGSARKYKINEVDASSNKITAYNASKGAIANAYSQLTIQCLTPDVNYQILPITLYLVENTTAYGSATPNTVPNITAISLDIVFKMENTRPILKDGVSNVVDVNVNQTLNLSLNSYFYDADAANNITTSTHTITGVTVPANEFILLSKQQVVLTPNAPNASYYNKGSVVGSTTFTTTAQGNTPTGFDSDIIYNATAGGTDTSREAFMRVSYSGITLTVTGLRSSFSQYTASRANPAGHFYLLLHISDKRDTADNGIWLPIAFRVGYTASYAPVATVTDPTSATTGQNKLTVYPTADGGVGDTFYFAPMAVTYGGTHVIGQYLSGGSLTASGLQPLALDGDNYTTTTGVKSRTGKLNEFLTLSSATTADSLVKSVSETGYTSSGGVAQNKYIKAELIDLYVQKSYFATAAYGGGRIVAGSGSATDNGFKYISTLGTDSSHADYYTFKGIKITLKSATMNRYFYATVGVTDITGATVSTVDIAIRVKNTAPSARKGSENMVATFDTNATGNSAHSSYAYDPDNTNPALRVSTPTITYSVPLGSTFMITPYDIGYDYDLTTAAGVSYISEGFTLNGLTGKVNNGLFTVNAAAGDAGATFNGLFDKTVYGSGYLNKLSTFLNSLGTVNTVKKVSSAASGTAAGSATVANQSVRADKLFFARTSDPSVSNAYEYNPTASNFSVNMSNTTGFVTVNYGSSIKIGDGTFPLDFIMVSTSNRTTQPAVLTLTVRDRYGDSNDGSGCYTVRVVIEVVNTRPTIKNPAYYEELAALPVTAGEGNITPKTFVFTPNGNDGDGLMTDPDNDRPEFLTSRGVLIANTRAIATMYDLETFDSIPTDHPDWLVDGDGGSLTRYVSATVVSRTGLSVTALSSTKAIETGVFVYFFVTDNTGGMSIGYVQIEVINTAPEFNTSDTDGFDPDNPLWNIESTSDADITRVRYVTGSQSAKNALKTKLSATDDDIRLIAKDADALHVGTVLAQRTVESDDVTNETAISYVTLPKDGGALTEAALSTAVPKVVNAKQFGGAAASVVLYTVDSGNSVTPGTPEAYGYTAELIFYVNGVWVDTDDVITALTGHTLTDSVTQDYFDGEGRWIVNDWALRIQSTEGFSDGARVGFDLSVRDVESLGGDTSGKATAYNSDRSHKNASGALDNKVVVEGLLTATFYQYISRTGIRSINEYLGKNGDYYTVEHSVGGNTVNYVSTYDGSTASTYSADLADIRFTDVNNNPVLSDSSTATLIKERKSGNADNTLAGVNSGARYAGATAADLVGAFKYTDTIRVTSARKSESEGSGYVPVYVPMSYFGMLENVATPLSDVGSVNYRSDYVIYDTGSNGTISLADVSTFESAISISDGSTSWGGDYKETSPLSDNPYIDIAAFWYDISSEATAIAHNSSELFTGTYGAYSAPYYNNRLATVTTDSNGRLLGYEKYSANYNNFVGDGNLMYLGAQAYKLKEHNFGLSFTKKNVRTGVRDLTIVIKLAKYDAQNNQVSTASADRRTVELKINVENSQFDLATDSTVKWDETRSTYYTELNLNSAQSRTYALVRRDALGNTEAIDISGYGDMTGIAYTDDDYVAATGSTDYRDYAYFSSDSFLRMTNWQAGQTSYKHATLASSDGTALENTVKSDRAQRSVMSYFKATTVAAVEAIGGEFMPNNGLYGSSREKYSGYFSASLAENGRILNITALRKTFINDFVLTEKSAVSQAQVKALYLERGLIAEYDDDSVPAATPSKVYYPFKTLIYDSCGAGWDRSSVVAIEIRVSISNGSPTLKTVGKEVTVPGETEKGREFDINLAVGNTVNISLYDIVSDPDIYVTGQNGIYSLATEQSFKEDSTGIARETGDYLDSPLEHDTYRDNPAYDANNVSEENGEYYRNGGGFSESGSTARDVIMWMETTQSDGGETVLTGNNIFFTVNRRTTATYENSSISVNKYKFTLRFYDGLNEYTAPFTFVINITNQAPSITATDRSFTMRAGDDLTVLTTYYDVFTGATGGKSAAYSNSYSKRLLDAREARAGYGTTNGDGQNTSTGRGYWVYNTITTENCESAVKHDSSLDNSGGNVHLGYYALANDDTPWRLRISGYQYNSSNNKLWVSDNLMMTLGTEGTGDATSMAIYIRAQGACVNEPVIFTLSDGEGGFASVTLYFTVISSKPMARDYSDPDQRVSIEAVGLEGVPVTDGSGYIGGMFRLYTVPSVEEQQFDINGITPAKTARRVHNIALRNIAVDLDGDNETNNMTLYRDGCFTVNDTPLTRGSDGFYRYDYFYIDIKSDGKSFDIVATGFNPNTPQGYEVVTFLIADYGNGSADNTLLITLRVYTMYSDLINEEVADLTSAQYTDEYLDGSNTVTVKSFDAYYGSASEATQTSYALVQLTGNAGTDGNNGQNGTAVYPVTDLDASKVGDAAYSVRLYAFFDVNDGEAEKLSAETLGGMLVRNARDKTFELDKSGDADYSRYLVGGVLYNGSAPSLSSDANARISILDRYVDFEFADGGIAIAFTPVASTLDNDNLLMYAEVEKYVADGREYKRADATLYAGTLFTLKVTDSAPVSSGASYNVSGKKGDTVEVAKIHDPDNPYNAMFVDSDNGDAVTVSAFDDDAYESAMSVAMGMQEFADLDWQAGNGKPRAFDISISVDNKLVITVNRRIDYIQNGRYMPSVTFPVVITGHDNMGETATSTVMLTVSNTDITAVAEKTDIDPETGIGYSFVRDESNGTYSMNVRMRYDTSLDIYLDDILSDADYTDAEKDTDSYRFIELNDVYPYACLYDDAVDLKWFATKDDGSLDMDNFISLATVSAIGDDATRRTGIHINAFASVRNLTGTMYLCVIDRSADDTLQNVGLRIRIDIVVMNNAPHTLEGKESSTVYMMGADSSNPKGMLFFIGDFVNDTNTSDVVGDDESSLYPNTYLRIFRQEARVATSIFSPRYESSKGENAGEGDDDGGQIDSSALFTVTIPQQLDRALIDEYLARDGVSVTEKDTTNEYNQWFVITPVRGFFGEGSVDITIADGESYVDQDTLTTTFHINVHVIYDEAEAADTLNPIEIACCKTRTLDIGTLMPEIVNKLAPSGGSAVADTFSHSHYYEIGSIEFLNSTESKYAAFERVGSSTVWTLTAGKQVTTSPVRVNVSIVLITDRTKVYNKYFWLNIIANQAPKTKYSEITFTRYSDPSNPDALRDLNDSGTIRLEAWQLFSDADDEDGNAIRMLSAKSQVESLVKVSFEKDENGNNRYLVINFAARGESEITVTVADETGTPVELKFLARNDDMPEASLWMRIIASFEANMVMWAIIIGCAVLVLVIFIIIIAVIKKRKREREELEALLVSEMEIEEQMLKLAGGPSPTDYRSYGYLPPADMSDNPDLMLGAGMDDAGFTGAALPPPPDGGSLPPQDDGSIPPRDGGNA